MHDDERFIALSFVGGMTTTVIVWSIIWKETLQIFILKVENWLEMEPIKIQGKM